MPTLTAILPATDGPTSLGRCVRAIESADDPPEELVVVDRPAGCGPAGARNLGAARAAGEVLVFVDSDVEVWPNAFQRIRRAFDADPALTAVFGSYDDSPAAPGQVSTFRNLLHHHVHQSAAGPATTFWAGLGAVRRDAFLAVGGFDDRRFDRPSIEDIDLGVRLTGEGLRITLDPDLQGKHLKSWGLAQMIRTDFASRGVPWVRLLLEADGTASPTALNLGWRHRLSAVASVVGVGAVIARRRAVATTAVLALVILNRDFYGVLARRGPATAIAGVGLHAVHHLTGVAAGAVGLAAHLRDGPGAGPSSRTQSR